VRYLLVLPVILAFASAAGAQDEAASRAALIAGAQGSECRITPRNARTVTVGEDALMEAAAAMIAAGEGYVDPEGRIAVSKPICDGGHEPGMQAQEDDGRALFIEAVSKNGCKLNGEDAATLLPPLGLTQDGVEIVAQIMLLNGEAEVDAADDDILRFKTEGCS
jgi:hypothetical protein